ncbi:unnamed protein product [Rotaria sp. Silwood2]|nr:unnamed protein product [Rotaria sp. Silwood2]CAF4594568.1 unnamed protein product [Rotaria sp. Silwood2]
MGAENKHWAKEIIQRTKRRDDFVSTQFVKKKINQLTAAIVQANAAISDLKIQLRTYWSQVPEYKKGKSAADTTTQNVTAQPTTTTIATTAPTSAESTAATAARPIASQLSLDKIRNKTEELEKLILKYSQHSLKRVEYDLPRKCTAKVDLSFKIDEYIINQDEAQATYNQMRQITKEFQTQAMTFCVQALARENELLSNEIKRIIEDFPQDNDDGFEAEPGYAAFKHYYNLREKRLNLCRG